MKTKQHSFPFRSLIPAALCCLLALPVVGLTAQTAFAESLSVAALAQKVEAISINSANAEEIAEAMRGVGIKKAQAIIEWRTQNGNFTSLEQLLEVKGIGEKTLEANKQRIKL